MSRKPYTFGETVRFVNPCGQDARGTVLAQIGETHALNMGTWGRPDWSTAWATGRRKTECSQGGLHDVDDRTAEFRA